MRRGDTKIKAAPKNPKAPESVNPEVITVESLFTEAGKLSDKQYIADLIKDTRKAVAEMKRGELDAPATHAGYVGPNSTVTWTGVFVQGDRACVTVAATGGARLDVAVFDGLGGSAHRTGSANSTISWYPRETKTYTIKITNYSSQGVTYRLINS